MVDPGVKTPRIPKQLNVKCLRDTGWEVLVQSAGLLTRAVTWAHTSPLPGACSQFSPELVTREQTEECGARWQGGGVTVSRFNLLVWCQSQVSQVHTRPLPLTSMMMVSHCQT